MPLLASEADSKSNTLLSEPGMCYLGVFKPLFMNHLIFYLESMKHD